MHCEGLNGLNEILCGFEREIFSSDDKSLDPKSIIAWRSDLFGETISMAWMSRAARCQHSSGLHWWMLLAGKP